MPKGRQTHVVVNVGDLVAAIQANKLAADAELSLEALKDAGLIKATGSERRLPLKARTRARPALLAAARPLQHHASILPRWGGGGS